MKWNKYICVPAVISAFVACSGGGNDDGTSPSPTPTQNTISIYATLKPFNAYTFYDATFQNGDEISVYALKESQNGMLLNQGNYADNVRYKYQDGKFVATTNGTKISQGLSLSYYAIFPYNTQNRNEMTFSVRTDQSTLNGYKNSDLRTAYMPLSSASVLNMQFYHSLCQVCASIESEQVQSNNVSIKLHVQSQTKVNISSDTYTATGETATISMYYDPTTKCHYAIVPPQTMSMANTFMFILYNGLEYPVEFTNDISFLSGAQHLINITFKPDNDGNFHAVAFKGQINTWNKN